MIASLGALVDNFFEGFVLLAVTSSALIAWIVYSASLPYEVEKEKYIKSQIIVMDQTAISVLAYIEDNKPQVKILPMLCNPGKKIKITYYKQWYGGIRWIILPCTEIDYLTDEFLLPNAPLKEVPASANDLSDNPV